MTVQQQWFEHFYIVGALATTVTLQLLVYIYMCCVDNSDGNTVAVSAVPHSHLAEGRLRTLELVRTPALTHMRTAVLLPCSATPS